MQSPRRSRHLIATLLTLASLALAGCATKDPADLSLQAEWQDPSHARLRVTNDGDRPVDMGDAMAGLRMTGPNGTVPMYWGGLDGTSDLCWMGDDQAGMHGHMGAGHCDGLGSMPMHGQGSMLQPGDTWTYQMHAMNSSGGWGMMMMPETPDGSWMMHGDGGHVRMAAGDYGWHMGGRQASATLG